MMINARALCAALILGISSGCASQAASPKTLAATSRPDDVACPRCEMKHYEWDTHRRGTPVHRSATVVTLDVAAVEEHRP